MLYEKELVEYCLRYIGRLKSLKKEIKNCKIKCGNYRREFSDLGY